MASSQTKNPFINRAFINKRACGFETLCKIPVYARGLVNISMACDISGDPREALRHVMCIASVWIANCDAYIRDLCQLMALNRNNTGLLETSKVKLATAQLKEVVQRGTV